GEKFELPDDPAGHAAANYFYFRLQSFEPQRALIATQPPVRTQIWQNGRPLELENYMAIALLEAGGNDFVVRVDSHASAPPVSFGVRAADRVEAVLPEKPAAGGLAERLQQAGAATGESIAPEFLKVDWNAAAAAGSTERGRRLFSSDGIGC